MATPLFVRAELWSDLACFSGTRQGFLTDILTLSAARSLDNRDTLTLVVARTNRLATSLVKLAVIRLVFSDTTFDEEWRITGIQQDQLTGLVTVTADWPLIDLSTRALLCSTPALVTDDQAPYAFEAIGLTPAQHWDNYVSRGFPAAWSGKVGRGTFDVNTPQDLVYDWDKPRKVIGDLAKLTNTEISYRRNASTSYLLDLLSAIGSTAPVVDVRLGKNLAGVTVKEDENKRATTVYPRSALVDGVSYGLAQNRWQIAAMNAGAKTIDLVDPAGKAGPIAFDHQFGTTGLAWRVFKANGPPVSASNRVITDSAVANQRLTVSVDPTLIFTVGDWLCFGTVDGSGNYAPIWSLNDGPQAIADPPVAVLKRDDVVAGINLFPNPVMRTWSGGAGTAPDSWINVGATLTKRTTAADYQSGGQSCRVQTTANGQGINTALINVTPTVGQPAFTAFFRFRIDALTGGAKVGVTLYCESFVSPIFVQIFPNTWGKVQSAADSDQVGQWITLAISTPLRSSTMVQVERAQLQIFQEGAGTADFTVDCAQLTQTSYQLPLIEGASGNVLWQAANELITDQRSAQREYLVELLDLASSDPAAFPYDQLYLGQTLRVTDADVGLAAVSLRLMAITRQHITNGTLTPAKVQVTVGLPSPSAADLLAASDLNSRQGIVSAVSGAGSRTGNAPVIPPDFSATLASLAWYNVKDPAYGAIGDGSVNDTAAIAAANAAAMATGGTVYFPRGTYLVDLGTLKIDSGSYLAWIGDGDGAAILKANAAGTGHLLEISSTGKRVLIEKLKFLGNGLAGASGHGNAIAMINRQAGAGTTTFDPQHSMVRQVEVTGFRGNALDETGASIPACGYFAFGATVHAVIDSVFFQCGMGIRLKKMFKHQFFAVTVDQCDKNALYIDSCENIDLHGVTLNGSGDGTADAGNLHIRNTEGFNMFGGRNKNGNPYCVNLAGTTYANRAIGLHEVSTEQLDAASGSTAVCVSTGTEGFVVEGCPFLFVNTMTTAVGIKLIQGPGGYSAVGHTYERNTFMIGDGGTISACIWLAVTSNKALGVRILSNVIGGQQAHGSATTIAAGILLDNICSDAFLANNAFITGTLLTITDCIKLATATVLNTVLWCNTYTALAGTITTQLNNAGGVTYLRFESGTNHLPALDGLSINNALDAALNVILRSGLTADNATSLRFTDRTGANKYSIQKTAGNQLAIVDDVAGQNILTAITGGNTALHGSGTGKLLLNSAGGTGGVEFYDGVGAGPTLMAKITADGRFTGKRVIGNGTAHVAGDYALSAGWGTTATVSTVSAKDTGGRVSITSSGTGQAANPTVTLTWKDGTWTTVPSVAVSRGEHVAPAAATWENTTPGATTIVFTFLGTPVAGSVYILDFVVVGK